jgi:RNA polymerase sigma-70 factor (ECF subfamily)
MGATPRAMSQAVTSGVEADLLKRSLAGEQEALEVIFSRHAPALYQTALRLVGTPEDAQDVVQEGMLNAFRNLRRFEGRSQFSTWLTRIVINAGLMRLRSRRAKPVVSLDEQLAADDNMTFAEQLPANAPNPEQLYAREELRAIVSSNLDTLSPVLRSAFLLREVQGLSTQEAAESLGISEGTLKARLHRAKRQLTTLVGRALQSRRETKACRREQRLAFDPLCSACASD